MDRQTLKKKIAVTVLDKYEGTKKPTIISEQKYISKKLKEIRDKKYKNFTEEKLKEYIQYNNKDIGVVILGNRELFKNFKKSDIIFIDGTFRTSPKGYSQLYMIHGIIDEQNVPLFYCLLKNKESETYKCMFEAIDNLTDKGITTHKFTLMGDMEIVHFNKFIKNENITIKTCQFHFNQTICKYAKKIKCCKELVEDLMVLAISPIE